MAQYLHKLRDERGFTLIELLIVIIILGILAAVVIFAVGGITDRGQTAACDTDRKTIQTAEEANFAQNSNYVSEAQLVTNGFLTELSTLHDVTVTGGGTGYTIQAIGACATP